LSSLLIFGFLLGLRHAIEADHVAAVASLTTKTPKIRDAVPLGALWGVGHTLTIFTVGAIVMSMDQVVPERIAGLLELVVGVMLLWLGGDVLWRLWRDRIHFHVHRHQGGVRHFHAHSHKNDTGHGAAAHRHRHAPNIKRRALLVGIMHGMAGSAAVVVLTASQATSFVGGLVYIAIFGGGSIAGMALLTLVISWPMRKAASTMGYAYNVLTASVGVITVGLGISIIYANLGAL